jgi:hypothetical protein
VGFEPGIFSSGVGRDDHYATPQGQLRLFPVQRSIFICFETIQKPIEDDEIYWAKLKVVVIQAEYVNIFLSFALKLFRFLQFEYNLTC